MLPRLQGRGNASPSLCRKKEQRAKEWVLLSIPIFPHVEWRKLGEGGAPREGGEWRKGGRELCRIVPEQLPPPTPAY